MVPKPLTFLVKTAIIIGAFLAVAALLGAAAWWCVFAWWLSGGHLPSAICFGFPPVFVFGCLILAAVLD